MKYLNIAVAGFGAVGLANAAIDDGYSTDGPNQMGPAAFMWPKDRVWSASTDNTAPCGSVASPQNRSQFPLTNGHVALVDQHEGFNLQLSVSYLSNPTQNTDFNVLISPSSFKEIDLGHTCVPVPNAPSSVTSGSNATLQIKYTSDDQDNKNETYYACADIEYVDLSQFNYEVPCFNATEPATSGSGSSGNSTGSSGSSDGSSSGSNSNGKSSSGSKLSGGDIAGIVIGSVAGAALLVAAGLLYQRRRQRRRVLKKAWPNEVDPNSYPMKPQSSRSNN